MDEKKYSAIVWERGVATTKEYYQKDRRAWPYNVGSAILVAIITPIVSWLLGLTAGNQLGLFLVAGGVSGIVWLVLWLVGAFLYHLFSAPASLYLEQKEKADLYTTDGIALSEFVPSKDDIRPSGIMLTNRKSVPIRVAVFMVSIWHDRTQIAASSLPKPLRWYIDGSLRPTYEDIEAGKSSLIALEHIETERERGTIRIHVGIAPGGKIEVGELDEKVIGLEFGGELGVAVRENKPLRVEILFDLIVQGLRLKCRHQFVLSYDGRKLSAQEIGDWILDRGPYAEPPFSVLPLTTRE